MITVTLTRTELIEAGACGEGLALFDAIANGAESVSAAWTPLAAVWLAVGAHAFAGWLASEGLVPRAYLAGANLADANLADANLAGANLDGAYYPSGPLPAGWVRDASGHLVREAAP